MVKVIRGNGLPANPAGGADDVLAQWRARAGAATSESNAAIASDTTISRAELEKQLGLSAAPKAAPPPAAPAGPATLGQKVDGVVNGMERVAGMAMFVPFIGLPLAKGLGWVASQPFNLIGKKETAANIRAYTGGQVEGKAAVGLGRIPDMTVGDVLGVERGALEVGGGHRVGRMARKLASRRMWPHPQVLSLAWLVRGGFEQRLVVGPQG
jgi:hypothetical protein